MHFRKRGTMKMNNRKIGTKCVQGGYTAGNGEPRQVPIIQSTTFKYTTGEAMGKLFDLEASGYFYSRLQNPTCDTVAAKICEMEGGSAAIAAYYAGDFLTMYENNSDLEFFYPEGGTNLYVDAMCIPKESQNKLAAERYIDFMLMVDEDFDEGFFDYMENKGVDFYSPAVANAEYTYYATPNQKVVDDEGYRASMNSIKDDAFEKMYDKDALMTATYYQNLTPEKLKLINELWEELKSDIDVSPVIIIICVVIVVSLVGGVLFFGIRKRYRNNY